MTYKFIQSLRLLTKPPICGMKICLSTSLKYLAESLERASVVYWNEVSL